MYNYSQVHEEQKENSVAGKNEKCLNISIV